MVWFPLLSKARAWFWASLAAFALVWFLPTLATRAQRTNERANAIAKAQAGLLAEDPLPKSPKMLLFPHGLWYETVTLAAALDRGGLNHFVAPIWRVMFGDPHQLYRASLAEAHQPLSWWQIDTPLKAQGEEWKHWIKEAKVRFLEPADFGALPMTLNFAKDGNVDPNTSYGLSLTDPDFTWTESKRILLRWKAYKTERDVVVTLDLGAFTAHKVKEQKVSLAVNGERCGSFSVAKRSSLQVRIPQAVWNRGLAKRENTLSLDIPDATSPAEHRFSADRRLLGLQLYSMYFSAME
jgi:hypothetical protein